MGTLTEDDLVPPFPDIFIEYIECPICACLRTSWRILPCTHVFCSDCVGQLPRNECPMCKVRYNRDEVRPNFHLNSLTSSLLVYCDVVGRENGCPWEGRFDCRHRHIEECDYRPVPCEHHADGCSESPLRKDTDEHLLECGFHMIACPHQGLGCQVERLRKDMASHAASCTFRSMGCAFEGCTRRFEARAEAEKAEHELQCDYRPVRCGTCGQSIPARMLLQHLSDECLEIFFKNDAAIDDVTSVAISNGGGIPAVLQLLRNCQDSTVTRNIGSWLCQMSSEEVNRSCIAREGGVDILLSLLHHEHRRQHKLNLSECLLNLISCDSADISVTISDEILVLVTLLRVSCSTHSLVRVASRLSSLSQLGDNVSVMLQEGVVPPLVELLGESRDENVQTHIIICVRNLALNDEARALIGNVGGIPSLVDNLCNPDLRSVHGHVVACLTLLAINEDNRGFVSGAGAIPHLVTMLDASSVDPTLLKLVLSCLTLLARNDNSRETIISVGAIPVLERISRNQDAADNLQRMASVCHTRLTYSGDREAVTDAIELSSLAELLRSPSDTVESDAIFNCLSNIMFGATVDAAENIRRTTENIRRTTENIRRNIENIRRTVAAAETQPSENSNSATRVESGVSVGVEANTRSGTDVSQRRTSGDSERLSSDRTAGVIRSPLHQLPLRTVVGIGLLLCFVYATGLLSFTILSSVYISRRTGSERTFWILASVPFFYGAIKNGDTVLVTFLSFLNTFQFLRGSVVEIAMALIVLSTPPRSNFIPLVTLYYFAADLKNCEIRLIVKYLDFVYSTNRRSFFVSILATSFRNTTLQQYGVFRLARYSETADGRVAVARAGTIPLLVHLLSSSEHPGVLKAVTACLGNLALDGNYQDRISAAGAIALLVGRLRSSPGTDVYENVAKCLTNVCGRGSCELLSSV
eukprot:Rmarinus@m.23555